VRIFAIGDIHGCSTLLRQLLKVVDLSPADRVVTLGDYINKGPDTKGVLDQLIAFAQSGQLIALRGNHELRMLAAKAQQAIEMNDEVLLDQNTLSSYDSGSLDQSLRSPLTSIPDAHWKLVAEQCLDAWESENHIFVHASLDPNKSLSEQPTRKLFWEKFDNPKPHVSGKTLVCGHTRQKSGEPLNLGHAICIDTWAWGNGWLTGLEVTSGDVWQVNKHGKVKRTHIDTFRR